MIRVLLIFCFLIGLAFNSSGQNRPTKHIVQGGSVTLHAHAEGALSFLWFKNGEPINGSHNEKIVAGEAGIYTVMALNGDCESDISDPVEIIIDPNEIEKKVDMKITKSASKSMVLLGSSIDYQLVIVNNSENVASGITVRDILPSSLEFKEILGPYAGTASYLPSSHTVTWLPGDLPAGRSEELRIRTNAVEKGKAENYAEVETALVDPNLSNNTASTVTDVVALRIPNIFTPNGDGINDFFEIVALELFPENELFIFNRWGAELYREKNYRNDWNGQNLNEATYYYVLRIKMENGSWQNFKGYITLKRGDRVN
ncbi:T9SS type B sorting domain-containing protein [Olivibacter domesticus]|uniref:Conserved repeat domain-containing protein/gliding motility-associated C-terminal domain-containing protein n=1 Tax=Olivibacter domesticus TaxID=407022 RepID=A0A1H7LE03_OLID1|nr:gliding motility-associated C-terminal domain-containing protein [Olivibacter domesticus]SEK97212.1 conserved repeat domain-containing protein/gliding motility-associated C-terminal domain-containing protein [Olivibacter domesticus]